MTVLIIMIAGILAWLVIDGIVSERSIRRSIRQGEAVQRKMEQVFALLKAKLSEEELCDLAELIYNESGNAPSFASLDEEWQRLNIEAARRAEEFVKRSLFRHYEESNEDQGRQ